MMNSSVLDVSYAPRRASYLTALHFSLNKNSILAFFFNDPITVRTFGFPFFLWFCLYPSPPQWHYSPRSYSEVVCQLIMGITCLDYVVQYQNP
jgi:hypothetical protein